MSYGRILAMVSTIWVASEILLAVVGRSKAGESRDRLSLHVLWICITVSVFAGSFLRAVRTAHMGGGRATYLTGLALIVGGLALRWIAILTLRNYFTVNVAIRGDHRVIEHGIYRIVRHPAYLGSLISFVGLGIAFMNWLSLAAILTGSMIGFAYRIRVEERALVTALGDEYRAYAARTSRLIPGIF